MMNAFLTFTIVAAIVAATVAQETPPCALANIDSEAACDAICQETGQAPTYSASTPSCVCGAYTVCSGRDYTPYVLYLLENQLNAPQKCFDLYTNAISNTLIDCFIDGGAEMVVNVTYPQYFDSAACSSSCVTTVLSATEALLANGKADGEECSIVLESFGANFFDIINSGGSTAAGNLCARGGDGYCGDFGHAFFSSFFENANLTMADCTTLNNRGNCLGNYASGLSDYYNSTVVNDYISKVVNSCSNFGIDVSSAASATETPADISSGSLIFGSFFALLAAAAVSLLFN